MCYSFARLVSSTEMCLQENPCITAENLKTFFTHCIKELGKKFKSSDTIPKIMQKVFDGGYWSFFNFELLKELAYHFCEGTLIIEKLQKYMSDFKKYCQRRVSEVPCGTLKSDCPKSHVFRVKMDKIFSLRKTKLSEVKVIQQQIQAILKLETVLLTDVQGGCIELTFQYFTSNRVFPIEETEIAALAEINVKWLRCGKYEVSPRGEIQNESTPMTTISTSGMHVCLTASFRIKLG